jgi:hypothetical protein
VASVEDIRRMSMALPETEEVLTWGEHPTFRVRGRIFAIAGEDPARVSIKTTPDVQADLIDLDGEAFRSAPHVGRFGWVEVMLDRVDAEMLRPLLLEAWRMTAPKRLVRDVDAGGQPRASPAPR